MRLLTLLIAFALAGCGGGPGSDPLRQDAALRLDQALPGVPLSFASFTRRGDLLLYRWRRQ